MTPLAKAVDFAAGSTAVTDRAPASIEIASEADARLHLAAVYRLLAHFGMDDLIYTHASARVPGEATFLINPFGLLFREITPSNLVKVDHEGQLVGKSEHPANAAGFVIHGAVLAARPDVACVIHSHTQAGVAVSCLEEGLLPLSQFALEFHGRVGCHDYEGIALDLDEQRRLARDLGQNVALLLRNHGLLTAGPTIPAAFSLMYYLEQAARVQMDVLAAGRPFRLPPEDVCRSTAAQFTSARTPQLGGSRLWPPLIRLLDAVDPGWRG
jgi:ribulose-5-phosphate 4-epimerase/fuculose-1-phosphate aldolase